MMEKLRMCRMNPQSYCCRHAVSPANQSVAGAFARPGADYARAVSRAQSDLNLRGTEKSLGSARRDPPLSLRAQELQGHLRNLLFEPGGHGPLALQMLIAHPGDLRLRELQRGGAQ